MSVEDLTEHGFQLILAMYNAPVNFRKPNIPEQYKPSTTQLLESFRVRMYLSAVAKNKKVLLNKMIATVDGVTQHLKRVYLQVQNWLNGENFLEPTEWGWELKENFYEPLKMTQQPGPPNIMQLIFCGCKTNCGNACGCRKQGLNCNIACKNCMGTSCTNVESYSNEELAAAEFEAFVDENEDECEVSLEENSTDDLCYDTENEI